jgi:hypothetical protein
MTNDKKVIRVHEDDWIRLKKIQLKMGIYQMSPLIKSILDIVEKHLKEESK